jgi:hypothetical protein
MISQLPLRAFENNKLENLMSRKQLLGALLSRHPQAVCPRQKLRLVDDVRRAHRHRSRARSRAAALMLHTFHGPQAHESMPPDREGDNMSGDGHVR